MLTPRRLNEYESASANQREKKVEIIKRHLVDSVPVSELCDEYKIQPTQFYSWQKQLFESDEKAFERKSNPSGFRCFGEEADTDTLALSKIYDFRKRSANPLCNRRVSNPYFGNAMKTR